MEGVETGILPLDIDQQLHSKRLDCYLRCWIILNSRLNGCSVAKDISCWAPLDFLITRAEILTIKLLQFRLLFVFYGN